MPAWIINLGASISGAWDTIHDLLPLLGGIGGLLGVGSAIAMRGAASTNAAELWKNIHPTPEEMATISVCVAVIKSHFNHQANAAAIAAQPQVNQASQGDQNAGK